MIRISINAYGASRAYGHHLVGVTDSIVGDGAGDGGTEGREVQHPAC